MLRRDADAGKIICARQLRALVDCEEDAERLGCLKGVHSRNEELDCLEMNLDRVSMDCRFAMRELTKCMLTPHRFLPMEIASVMLLATTYMVVWRPRCRGPSSIQYYSFLPQ